jgi:predicted transcriptional regulator
VWLGQEKRRAIMDVIKAIAKECLPMGYNEFASIVSYRVGLSYRKITDDYLRVLLNVGFLQKDENQTLTLGDIEQ